MIYHHLYGASRLRRCHNLSQQYCRDALSTTLSPVFTETILRDQEVFQSEEGLESLLQTLPESVARVLRSQWQGKGGALSEVPKTSEAIWKDILKLMGESKFVSEHCFGCSYLV